MKNEIMVAGINTAELTNKDLTKNLIKMARAVDGANKNAWEYAVALADIFNKEQYKQDFGEKKVFAEKANISAGRVSQCTKAVSFVTVKGINTMEITVDNAYCIGSITKKEVNEKGKEKRVDDYVGFLAYMQCHEDMAEEEVYKLSNGKLKEYIKAYKEDRDMVIDSEITAEEEIDKPTDEKKEVPENVYLIPEKPWFTIGIEKDVYVMIEHIANAEDIITRYGNDENAFNQMMIDFNKKMATIKEATKKLTEVKG